MKTIKIFLASSEELAEERIRFGDFIRKLDDTYEIRGYRIKLFKWEDLPSGDDGRPKQDEYNDKVRECDMFVGLFYTKAGEFTLEEYETAKAAQKSFGKPTLYVFCRELAEGKTEDFSLTKFKEKLINDIRQYWSKYNSSDALQLQFVLQLLKVENSQWNDLKVENGSVRLGETEIARMDNLRFAADNKDYQRMSKRLDELPEEIEDTRLLAEEHPDKVRYKDKLQKLLNESAHLQKEYDRQQQLLLDTAIRIVQLQGNSISEKRRQAEEAFERGDVQMANIILKEAERNGDIMFEDYERNEALQMERKKNVHKTIDDLLLQVTTIMAEMLRPIEKRITEAKELYRKADYRAGKTDYDIKKYSILLYDYAQFLYKYGFYKDAEAVYLRQIPIIMDLRDNGEGNIATSFNDIGLVYDEQGDYDKALEYYFKALAIYEKVLGMEHPFTATSYNNIGIVCDHKGDYEKALKYHLKALAIREKVLCKEHPDIATSHNNIGTLYNKKGDYDKALEYLQKALALREKILGTEHPLTAVFYHNIGAVYHRLGDYDKALEYYFKDLAISELVLGKEHPATAISYNSVGWVYKIKGDYDRALAYHLKALEIDEKVLGTKHPKTAQSYNYIGSVYKKQGDYEKALAYHLKALEIDEKVFGTKHPETAQSYNNIGSVLNRQGDHDKALEYHNKALAIRERILGTNHSDTAQSYNNIGWVYREKGEYETALNYYTKAYQIVKNKFGEDHPNTKSAKKSIDFVKKAMRSSR